MRMLKWLIRSSMYVLLIIAACYGLLVLLNLKDEPLSTETKAFIAGAELDIPPKQNGYLAALGWRAPKNTDWHAAGWRTLEQWRVASAGKTTPDLPPTDLSVVKENFLCEFKRADCLEKVSLMGHMAQKVVFENVTLLDRINSLSGYQYFYVPPIKIENPFQSIYVPSYRSMWRLGATASAYLWSSGKYQKAIETITARIVVARRMLRDSSSALQTAFAVAWLRSEYLLISEIFHRYPDVARAHLIAIKPLLEPLTDEELKATRWLHGEFATLVDTYTTAARSTVAMHMLLSQLFLNLKHEEILVLGELTNSEQFYASLPKWYVFLFNRLEPLFQPNATANLHFKVVANFEVDARAARKEVGAMAFDKIRTVNAKTSRFSVFNPVGLRVSVFDPYEFIFRVHDIDRFIRLVSVQAELTKARVKADGVEAFLEKYPGAIDPATGERMRWNVARSRVYVPAMAELWSRYSGGLGGQVGEISVKY